MPSSVETAVRAPSLLEFKHYQPVAVQGVRRWSARGQNFDVTWLEAVEDGARFDTESGDETMLLLSNGPITISGAKAPMVAPARSVCILPPGRWQLHPGAGATCAVLRSLREDATTDAINQAAYTVRDARIAPVGPPYVCLRDGDEIRVIAIDAIAAPKDKPRLKMLQSSTVSINWVEYQGPRDRAALSPHVHAAFEQGSLALAGEFVHHLRVQWEANANLWQEDRHARLGSASLLVVPVGMIHTSEGVGPGRHLLIDVFSPPRADFIAKGWIANGGDYAAPERA